MNTETYDARVRNALQTVVARHMGLAPPAGRANPTHTDASIAATIFDFSFATAVDLWIKSLEDKAEAHMRDEDSNFAVFHYNGACYYMRASEEKEDDQWREKAVGFHVSIANTSIRHASTNNYLYTDFHAADLHTVITRMAEVVRRNDCCALCKRLLNFENEMYCKDCKTHFNEPGCRECKCPFGELEDGAHPACKKRRLD